MLEDQLLFLVFVDNVKYKFLGVRGAFQLLHRVAISNKLDVPAIYKLYLDNIFAHQQLYLRDLCSRYFVYLHQRIKTHERYARVTSYYEHGLYAVREREVCVYNVHMP